MNIPWENPDKPAKHTILIVDDEPGNLEVVGDYLAKYGLQIMGARDGETGLALAQQDRPDLILLDVLLPDIDGFEVCRRLKADERTREIPIIFMTVLTSVEDKIKGFEAGGVDYISKPFQEPEVLARVTTHLRLRELTEHLEQQVRERTRELSKANQAYKALSDCNQALMHATEEGELLQEMCRIIVQDCGYLLVWIGFAEHDPAKTVRPVAQAGYEQGYLDTINVTWADTELGHGPTGTAIRTKRPVINQDVLTNPDFAPWRAEAVERGYASSAAFPLLTSEQEAIGALNVYASEPDAFTPEQINLLMELAGDLTFGLVSLRVRAERELAEEELRKHRDHLEELVQERTAELVVAKEQAEAANRAKSAFLANMSHELRTPLNAILGYAQILQRRPLDSDVISALNTVQHSGEHLLTLINDVLDIARIEAGRLELFPTPIHLPGFLDHVASIIRARAEAKGLSFTFEKSGIIPVGVQADETRLRQVLLNLLDNAVKFTDQGEVVLSVGVCEYESEAPPHPHTPTLRFSVRDTGIGIPPDQVERIFQPFEQVEHATRWSSGTGLGLAISHQLVHLMGGDLQVESQVDRGSTFWFEIVLPVTEMAVEAVQPPERTITGYRGPRRTVLVVDDVPSSRAILVDLLQPLGFEVVEAADGQQALHLAQELRPDLILMDRWMPVLDGLEAAQRMRQIPELREVPIVAVSASVSQEDQAQSREVGIDAFLPKPVSWPRLAALLQGCLALEWEYEKPIEVREKEGEAIPMPPPEEEMEILLDLARRGDMRAIRECAAHIETLGGQYVPFARRLRELAKSFDENQIRTLIERYMEEDQ